MRLRLWTFYFKGKSPDMREVGEKLKVANVLEGSVRRSGERLRITVQLVDVAQNHQIWSERYDRTMDDVFAVQDEIAGAIADRMTKSYGGDDKPSLASHAPSDARAYELYLKGRGYLYQEDLEAGHVNLSPTGVSCKGQRISALCRLSAYRYGSGKREESHNIKLFSYRVCGFIILNYGNEIVCAENLGHLIYDNVVAQFKSIFTQKAGSYGEIAGVYHHKDTAAPVDKFLYLLYFIVNEVTFGASYNKQRTIGWNIAAA